jgi:hypothetical protein
MTTLPIPKIYWDTFQTALQSKVKRLAKEVATCLGQSEQPLLKALASQKVDAYLFEEEGSEYIDVKSMRCKHLTPSSENAAVLITCNQPIILGKAACIYHEGVPKQTLFHPEYKVLKEYKVVTYDGETYWVASDNSVRDKADPTKCIGYYEDGCLIKLTIMTT